MKVSEFIKWLENQPQDSEIEILAASSRFQGWSYTPAEYKLIDIDSCYLTHDNVLRLSAE